MYEKKPKREVKKKRYVFHCFLKRKRLGGVPALFHLTQTLSEVVQTRSLALHDVAEVRGTRFAKVIVVVEMY